MSFWFWLFGKSTSVVPPPPSAPRPRAIGIVTVPGATVSMSLIPGASPAVLTTDAHSGYACWNVVEASLGATHLWITAKGYEPYSQHVDLTTGDKAVNQDIFIGTTRWDGVRPTDINLPALVFTFPVPHSLAEKVNVQCNFCNLRDSQGRVIFSSSIAALSLAEQDDWIAKEIAAGGTHYVTSVQTSYSGYFAPQINFYETGRMAEFGASLVRIIKAGLIPIVFLHSGDSYPGDNYFRGVCREFKAFSPDIVKYCLWCIAWEVVKGGYTSDEFNRANLIMREVLGDDATIAFHLSQGRAAFSSNPLEADDPWQGAEADCWTRVGTSQHPLCGTLADVFLYQSIVCTPGEVNEYGDPTWWDRTLDTVERFLPAGTPMPGAQGVLATGRNGAPFKRAGVAGVDGPDWFAGQPKRPALCLFEIVAYTYIRGKVNDAQVTAVANKAKSFGFTSFGNGLPKT